MNSISTSALQLIGNTPLISLDRIYSGPGRLLAKGEFVNPGGSIKDRAARYIIRTAYLEGRLKPGQPVVEMTSGNMGAGLAVVCNVIGNRFTAVMSQGNSPERVRMLNSLGAEVVLVPQVNGNPGCVTGDDINAVQQKAISIAREKDAFFVDQFNNSGSTLVHEQETGPEIWEGLEGNVDAFVSGVGSAGTFVGTSRFLKNKNPQIICAAVEPAGAEVLAGKPVTKPKHILQGIGYGSIPPLWEIGLADLMIAVDDVSAENYRQLLAEKEGLYVGYSAAANVCASIRMIQDGILGNIPTVVTILCDTGLKY
jgi:cysteine synthase A